MSESLSFEIYNRQQAWVAVQKQLFPFLKDALVGGGRWMLTVTRIKRTKAQNRRYWGNGVLAQIAAQAAPNGRMYSAETWHEQFKRMFIGVIELPNGEVQGMSSTALSTVEFCEFSDQVEAYAATELGVTFYDLQPHPEAPKAKPALRREEVAA